MAVDTNGKYRSFIWQEDNTSNYALYEDNLGVTSGAWSWSIMFGSNQTLYIHDYKIFGFAEFKELNLNELQ